MEHTRTLFAFVVGGALSFACSAGTIEVSPVKAISRPDSVVATPHEALERIRAARAKGDAPFVADVTEEAAR